MKYSQYQEKIIETYKTTDCNICVSAAPGSGKSFILKELSKRTPTSRKCLFVAFNKSIADELTKSLPKGIECCTFHSKGFKVLLSTFNFKPKVEENKCFKIGKKCLDLEDLSINENKYLFDLQTIWNALRVTLLIGTRTDIMNICEEKGIDFVERMVDDIKVIDKEWNKYSRKITKRDTFELDFTDMLYLPYVLIDPIKLPKYDVIMTDECQDLNTLQRELLLNYMKPKGRAIFVGDEKQCIYSFQGASVNNFYYLQNLPNTITLPLNTTYRCSKAIVAEAKKVFGDGIEASDTAEDGIVRHGELIEAQEGDFVLCRNNLPLVKCFLYFVSINKKATIKGKDLGDAICRILDRITSIEDLSDLLEDKVNQLMGKGLSRSIATKTTSYLDLEEKCEIIKLLKKNFLGGFSQLKEKIYEIFVEKTEGIVLCTCHKSKGLEADRVFFLNVELIPSEHATTETALYAERCLKFVAITRARKELVYCNI